MKELRKHLCALSWTQLIDFIEATHASCFRLIDAQSPGPDDYKENQNLPPRHFSKGTP